MITKKYSQLDIHLLSNDKELSDDDSEKIEEDIILAGKEIKTI